jgi:hypothetical protein
MQSDYINQLETRVIDKSLKIDRLYRDIDDIRHLYKNFYNKYTSIEVEITFRVPAQFNMAFYSNDFQTTCSLFIPLNNTLDSDLSKYKKMIKCMYDEHTIVDISLTAWRGSFEIYNISCRFDHGYPNHIEEYFYHNHTIRANKIPPETIYEIIKNGENLILKIKEKEDRYANSQRLH